MSWYATIEDPDFDSSSSSEPYKCTKTATVLQRQENYPVTVQSDASMPVFYMKADYNNPIGGYSITTQLDQNYGVNGRAITYSGLTQSQMAWHNNDDFGNGNVYDVGSWSNNTNPSINIDRYATFPVNLLEDDSPYIMVIKERGRFIFTEIGGLGRVLGDSSTGLNFVTPLVIFETIHELRVHGS